MKDIRNNNITYRTSQSAGRSKAVLSMDHQAMFRRIIASLLIILFALGTAPSFAGSVTYRGESKGFVLEPGSAASKTDIFPEFKNVMPGDTVTDTITVKNDSADEVKIYMRALDPDKDGADLLSQVTLTVDAKNAGKIFQCTGKLNLDTKMWDVVLQ